MSEFTPIDSRDRERYIAFELEAGLDPGTDYIVSDEEEERKKWRKKWTGFLPTQRSITGEALDLYLQGKKFVADAENDVEYARKYRGAPDDHGNEIGARPRFAYYQERQKILLHWLESLVDNIRGLKEKRAPGYCGDQYCQLLLDRIRKRIEDKKREIEIDLPRLAKEARAKLQILGKRKRSDDERTETGDHPISWDIGPVLESYSVKRTELDLSKDWVGGWLVGSGSFGSVSIWVQDDGGIVRNRAALKEVNLGDFMWNYPEQWNTGSPKAPSIPTEIDCHIRLRDKMGSSSVCKMFCWNIRRVQRQFRMYLEYCPGGNLAQIVNGDPPYLSPYGVKTSRSRADNELDDLSEQCKLLPEAFCWHAFETFALAGLLMQRGKLSQKGKLPWTEIIHRDIKPENVFVGSPSASRYIAYPELKIGDFGLAYTKRDWDKRKPKNFGTAGTPPFQAPEQLRLLKRGGLWGYGQQVRPMTSKTNVWGIGMLMWSMIAGRHSPAMEEIDFKQFWTKEPPDFDATAQAFYSKDLRNLIRACTRYDDEDRPSFDAIMSRILEHTTGGPNERAGGVRNLKASEIGSEQYSKYRFDPLRVDNYAVGLSVAHLPPSEHVRSMPEELKSNRTGSR